MARPQGIICLTADINAHLMGFCICISRTNFTKLQRTSLEYFNTWIFFLILEDICPFYGATDTLVLDFWWRLLLLFKVFAMAALGALKTQISKCSATKTSMESADSLILNINVAFPEARRNHWQQLFWEEWYGDFRQLVWVCLPKTHTHIHSYKLAPAVVMDTISLCLDICDTGNFVASCVVVIANDEDNRTIASRLLI